MLTQERLKELLHYDPETGLFTRLVTNGQWRAGRVVGLPSKHPYGRITLDGQRYCAHLLAWLYVYGTMPSMLDHKNLNRMDNRIDNLRLANKSLNAANTKARRDNACGVKGVCWSFGRWRAYIRKDGKTTYLGGYDTAELAGQAYLTAAISLFGEFARSGE